MRSCSISSVDLKPTKSTSISINRCKQTILQVVYEILQHFISILSLKSSRKPQKYEVIAMVFENTTYRADSSPFNMCKRNTVVITEKNEANIFWSRESCPSHILHAAFDTHKLISIIWLMIEAKAFLQIDNFYRDSFFFSEIIWLTR